MDNVHQILALSNPKFLYSACCVDNSIKPKKIRLEAFNSCSIKDFRQYVDWDVVLIGDTKLSLVNKSLLRFIGCCDNNSNSGSAI